MLIFSSSFQHGNTVLHEASWNGFSRCVQVLCNVYPKDLDDNANKEKLNWKKNHFINRVNFCGFSALHLAAQNGHNQTLRELLYAGCSTSIHNDYGDTPLHTACRYGHAGVVRILISAKCDVDAFNLNHDTPLHITCAMGRRKLTKLLLEAGAMQFQNLQHESARDIAQRKNLKVILEIMKSYSEKMEKKMIREAARCSKSPDSAPQNKKSKYNKHDQGPRNWSPYGCHYYPDMRKFPLPNLESLPHEPLQKGEQYYLDLGGNIRKGPAGRGNQCNCNAVDKESGVETCRNVQKFVEVANEKLKRKIAELATKAEKTERNQNLRQSRREKSRERNLDPLYPMLKIVGDRNKQMHLKSWLTKVNPDIGSNSDLQPSPRSSEIVREVAVDVHRESAEKPIKVERNNSRRMPNFDENGNNEKQPEDDEDSYTDISNESDESGNGSIASNNENCLYDEGFLRNFQHQQFSHQNDSVTSPSITSNQNIEMEMERIAKSLLLDNESLMVNRNPDVIKDHIHHSAKRSTKKIKSAINKPIASGELYVNTFFSSDVKNSTNVEDDVDSIEIDDLIAKVHQTIINSSNVSTVSSSIQNRAMSRGGKSRESSEPKEMWSQAGRSRNPLPIDIDEIENYTDNIFSPTDTVDGPITTSLGDNNFVLLDHLMKARKKFNHNYQQQLQVMNHHEAYPPTNGNNPAISVKEKSKGEFTIPSSSTLV